jgi:hypothetical protein
MNEQANYSTAEAGWLLRVRNVKQAAIQGVTAQSLLTYKYDFTGARRAEDHTERCNRSVSVAPGS